MTRRTIEQYNWPTLEFDETLLRVHFTSQSSKIVKAIVVHHMAMVGTGDGKALDAIYRTWQVRPASAHYGVDGKYVRQYVWDRDRAWATGNRTANATTISIEHANSTGKPTWKVSDQTMKTGARLVAQLHWVYRLGRPIAGKTLHKHKDYVGTECPGPYLGGTHWDEYVKLAQADYDLISANGGPVIPPPNPVRHYIVRAGDTLSAIARKFGRTVAQLTSWNRLPNADQIEVGQDLKVDEP